MMDFTTPEASDLQYLFRKMVDAGVTHAVVEVSSHGLHRHRLAGCHFDVGVFTNLSQDHLDYHGNLEQYFLAKQILFRDLLPSSRKRSRHMVVNLDDLYGMRLRDTCTDLPLTGFGTRADAAVRPMDVGLSAKGISGIVKTGDTRLEIESRLVGGFNLMNLLAAVAVSHALGIDPEAVRQGIAAVETIPGRLERVPSPVGTVLVDYAHTPAALKTVLCALTSFRNGWSGRIITVMGCGGDRDSSKRQLMGREAAAWTDLLVVTSDNPRSEDPTAIIEQVIRGVDGQGLSPYSSDHANHRGGKTKVYHVIPDRREAIAWAVSQMEDHDILLVAGKGHENYQEINGVRYPFDDREVLIEEFDRRFTDTGDRAPATGLSAGDRHQDDGPGRSAE